MKITANTLTLMRHSLGAVALAATVSAEAHAGNPTASLSDAPSATATTTHAGSVEQPKKAEEEKKKDEQKKDENRAPCPACGLG
jgi:hypothetical protein